MKQLTGTEKFTLHNTDSEIMVNDFWRWAYSDLLNNTYRGVLAEFLVYKSLIKNPSSQIRINWMPYDITSPSGRHIEVKSAAYLQSWEQNYYSKILFDISPKHTLHLKIKRISDIYVFCIYTALNIQQSILNLDLWDFYILPTSVLDNKKLHQKSITLNSLIKLNPIKADFSNLGNIIESIEL